MNKQEKEELVNQLNGRLMNYPSDSWDRGHNEGLKSAVIVVSNLPTVDEPTKVIAHLAEKWHEDIGPVLWWNFPVEEPPYCGTPLDDDFPKYKTHFTELHMPDEIEEEPLYTVTINLDLNYYLALDEGDGDDEISTTLTTRHGVLGYRYFLTEKEIKSIDERYWPFAVPVEEVAE
ncbi:DUF1642 domain-containing protein [Enterococcus pseudoavium]|uniref:DUF1642 domain-containing protein n=1 Tax=Enterococcus pseudoavium TaxID=44007 RepID=A0ABU3FIT9_9ENTE|nr:DUF1642 domain-containing protein [Enterococcus pseudoavium]MDT2770975.1 DUF1642 domain-containing protein [Enterococcus pseudoavium]